MKDKTALETVVAMPLPDYALEALSPQLHPQIRTMAFHQFYEAPIYFERSTRTFDHMSAERVAFRASFILNEALELIEKGLGVKLSVNIEDDFHEGEAIFLDPQEASFCASLAQSIERGKGRDLVEVVDALGDLNVVVNGFAIELGVDMDKIDREVCASNFTKADERGRPIIGDGTNGPVGKVLKGPNFMEPQIALMLGLGEE